MNIKACPLPLARFFGLTMLTVLFAGILLGQSSISLSSGSAPAGSPVPLALTLTSPATQPAGLQWTFTYPASSVIAFAATAGPALTTAGKTLDCAASSGSYTCTATGSNSNLIANGIVANVSITLAATASSAAVAVPSAVAAAMDGSQITTTASGGTATSTVIPVLSSLSCTPATLAPGAAAVCTVTMTSPVATQTSIALSSTTAVTVPASVSIAASAATATFTATAGSFTADQSATVTATSNGITKTANLSLVAPVSVTSLLCASTSLTASATTTCTVTISKAAPTGGSTITLSSSATAALTVPASASIAATATSATFTATAAAVTSNQTAILTAALNGSTRPITMTVTAPVITVSSLQCAVTTLTSSANTNCTASLSKAAPAGGIVVSLAATPAGSLTLPASTSIAAGATAASFPVTAGPITLDQKGSVTASLNGGTMPVALTLVATPLLPSSVACAATTLTPNSNTLCTVQLNRAAPAGGVQVMVSTSALGILTVPASVTVAAASTSAAFPVSTAAISAGLNATVRVQVAQTSVSTAIALSADPVSLSQLVCSPVTLAPGTGGTCTVTLTGSAWVNTAVAVKSTNVGLTVTPSVVVASGSSSANFPFSLSTGMTGWAIVSANVGTVTKSLTITAAASPKPANPVSPATSSDSQLRLGCGQRHIGAGGTMVCEIRYHAGNPADAMDFTVSSNSERVKVPASVQGRAGRNVIRFEVIADEDAAQENVLIEAHAGSEHAEAALVVLSSGSLHLRVPRNLTVSAGSPVGFTAATQDDQGLAVAVTVAGMPQGAEFDRTSGQYRWTPAEGELGSTRISFTATNSLDVSVTKTVEINVVSARPVLTGLHNGAGAGTEGCVAGSVASVVGTSLAASDSAATVRVLVNGSEASVVRASAGRIDFLCPALASGTAMAIAVKAGDQTSNELSTVMQQTAPGLFTTDGNGAGQAMAAHALGVAALPRFDRTGIPAVAGEAIVLLATGINCDENSAAPKPLLYFGHDYQRITLVRPSAFPGVCEVHAVVPAGRSGDGVEVFLESVREDGTALRSNTVRVAVEE